MDSNISQPAASDRFWMGATAVIILGIALRQFRLGDAPFHPDEAIHAFFSGGFATYNYNPTYHGPLLYHLVAAVFGLLGQHDYTARLVPSLLGIGLLGLIVGPLRVYLGNRGTIASLALVAVSPSIVSYSRRLLHDSQVLFLTMGAVLCLLVALENRADTTRGRNARIGLAAYMTLFLATKANCFFIAVMLGAFWIAWLIAGGINVSFPKFQNPVRVTRWIPPILFAVLTATMIAFPRDNSYAPPGQALEDFQHFQHLVFQIVAVLTCGGMGLWLLTGPRTDLPDEIPKEEKAADETPDEKKIDGWTTYVLALGTALWLYVFLFGNGAQTLIQWVSSHHFSMQPLRDGATHARGALGQMLEYWGGQQQKPRLPGRHDYYIVLMLLYEVPVLIAAIGGIWHASKHRSTFSDLLLWWALTSWAVYAVANEKVPWLVVHIVLPFALLGGLWLGQIAWKKPVLVIAALAGLFFSMRGVWGVNFERSGDNVEPMLYAQTPEAFRDALASALQNTGNDKRVVWMTGERQWPSVWYLRQGAPYMGQSVSTIAGTPTPNNYRAAVTEEKDWPAFQKAGWQHNTVDFLIWSRASWAAIEPHRYARWFWTRDTIPTSERALAQTDFKLSILSGRGEWSHATADVGWP